MTYKDKAFCASVFCKNKCQRQMTVEEHREVTKLGAMVSMAYFCDHDGELLQISFQSNSTQRGNSNET